MRQYLSREASAALQHGRHAALRLTYALQGFMGQTEALLGPFTTHFSHPVLQGGLKSQYYWIEGKFNHFHMYLCQPEHVFDCEMLLVWCGQTTDHIWWSEFWTLPCTTNSCCSNCDARTTRAQTWLRLPGYSADRSESCPSFCQLSYKQTVPTPQGNP